MDGVPVKISERCRPPTRVHLPATLRTLPPSELEQLTYSFDHEGNAIQWVQERRRNLTNERAERRRRLEAKDAERQRRRELAEAAAALQQEQAARAQQEQEAAEAAHRQQAEEERLVQEEQERLELFRLQRVASQEASEAVVETSALPAPAEDPSVAGVASSEAELVGTDQSPPAAAAPVADSLPVAQPAAVSITERQPSVGLAHAQPAQVSCPQLQTEQQQHPHQQELHQHQQQQLHKQQHQSHQQPERHQQQQPHHQQPHQQQQQPHHQQPQQQQQQHGSQYQQHQQPEQHQLQHQQQGQQWRQPAPASNNPYNPFVGGGALLQPQTVELQTASGTASNSRSGSFNYRDFESQASDPFDSVALKTINDMEVLASVFQPVTTQSCPQRQTQQQPASHAHQQAVSQTQQQTSHTQQTQQQPANQTQQTPSPRQQQQYFADRGTAASSVVPTGYSYQRAAYSGVSRPAAPSRVGFTPTAASQYRYPGYTYTGGAIAGSNQAPSTSVAHYPPRAGPVPSAAPAGFPATSSSSVGAVTSAVTSTASPADAQQLHEFYTRYYATPGRVSPGPTAPGLRSSRSVPDLCEQSGREADGGDVKRTKSHTPPPQAAAGGTQTWLETGDPLQGVSPEVRERLQELSQMGFPLDRLRRLHRQFDGDEKQVIEFALSAQRLEEAGHAPLDAEQGLLECDGDLGRAAEFLSSLAQLTGLGFPAPRALDALKKADMHRDRALDLLIQG